MHKLLGVGLTAILLASSVHAATAQLSYGLSSSGLSALSYNGVSLLASSDNGTIRFIDSTPDFTPSITGFNSWSPVSSSLNGNTISQIWSFGTTSCTYSQSGSTLLMNVSFTNTSASTITEAHLNLAQLTYPNAPNCIVSDENYSPIGGMVVIAHPNWRPPVIGMDYGSAVVDFCNENVNDGVAVTVPGAWGTNSYPFTARFYNVAPGATINMKLSFRFGASGSAESTASNIYQKYSAFYPFSLQWSDRRMVGTEFLTSPPPHPTTNPRGWFDNDTTVDVTTTSGLNTFRQRMIERAQEDVQVLQGMNAQGVVVWDCEGQQYPQPNVSYVGDPRLEPTMAPEMEYDNGDGNGKTIDAFFNILKSAGLKIGVCIRPQNCNQSTGQWNQNESTNIDATLEGKIQYANNRWGTTLYYVDTTVDPTGNVYDPSPFAQAAGDYPQVLLMPEEATTRFYSFSGKFDSFEADGVPASETPTTVYDTYPGAFSAVYAPDNSSTGATLTSTTSNFQYGCSHGDFLMFRGWFNDPDNPTIESIFDGAGMSPTVQITTPASNSNVAPSLTISATAQPASGKSISKVDFYQTTTTAGTQLIGTVNGSGPYAVNWNTVPGTYVLTAKATDSAGLTRTSASSVVTAIAATPFNTNAVFTTGTPIINGGADSYGNAYEANLLGASATFNGTAINFGPPNVADTYSNLTVTLPAGTYTNLNMIATAAGGILTNQTFIVNYTDGSTQSFTQSLSDWRNPQKFTNETQVVTMQDYLGSNGQPIPAATYVYGYTFLLNGKPVKSITLPATRGVVVFGFGGR